MHAIIIFLKLLIKASKSYFKFGGWQGGGGGGGATETTPGQVCVSGTKCFPDTSLHP